MTEICFNFDTKAASILDSFTKGENPTDLCFIEGKDKTHKTLKFTFECESLGPIHPSDYGHSVFCKINSSEDVTTMESIEDTAASLLPESINFKQFVKDEKFFLKLPFKNDKYKASIDPSFVPSQLDKSPFHQGSQVQIEFSVSMWINFSSSSAGLFLNVHKIVVDGGKKRTIKRR
jgi:hypothetical protein